MKRRLLVRLVALGGTGWAAGRLSVVTAAETIAQRAAEKATDAALQPLAQAVPGTALPAGWRHQTLSGIAPDTWTMVREQDGAVVAQVASSASASSILYALSGRQAQSRRLRWRWRSDALISQPSPAIKAGDDFAARVYVLFDFPLQRVPLGQRLLLRLARTLHGDDVPAAALCYVRDARLPGQSLFDSAYTSRVRMIVARDSAQLDTWFDESRDLQADFQRAFGAEYGPGMPPITAIALAADTDQTGGRVTTWFGGLQLDA